MKEQLKNLNEKQEKSNETLSHKQAMIQKSIQEIQISMKTM
jgi:hypothetical protein